MARKLVRFLATYAYALACCYYLFAVGFLSRRHRHLIRAITGQFRYDPRREPVIAIPQVQLSDLFGQAVDIHLAEIVPVYGNMSMLELTVLVQLVKARRPHTIFEIGTFDGRTALNMALNSPPDATIYTLDLPKEQLADVALPLDGEDLTFIDKERSGARFAGTAYERQVIQLYGDSATFDFSPYVGQVDLVFVDGSHSREYVAADSLTALWLLRDGKGVIVWHDYTDWPGVTRALNDLYAQDKRFHGAQLIEGTTLVCLATDC